MKIRFSNENDIPVIRGFIQALAEYEKLSDEMVATEQDLKESLFGAIPQAEVLLAEEAGKAVGFALFFHNYSTFLGRRGLYLEDLFVLPEQRGKGYGVALLSRLAKIAMERNCGRMEWAVLDWNQSAIDFYHSIDAVSMNGWTTNRLTGQSLIDMASHKQSE